MSAFWNIVADAVEDHLEHEDWCDLSETHAIWGISRPNLHRFGVRCCCLHGPAIEAIRQGPLA